jgi:O-antigen ligase
MVPTLGARTTHGGGANTEWVTAPGIGQLNLSGRAVIWDDVWNGLIRDTSLFGHGLGATQQFMSTRYVLPHDVHNTYLLLLADIGVVGLVAYVGFIVAVAVTILRLPRHRSGSYSALTLGLLLLLTLSGFVQNPLYVYGSAPMFLFAALAFTHEVERDGYPTQLRS